MPSREVIKKPYIDLIKTIREHRLNSFNSLGVTLIPKNEITELVLKDSITKLFKGGIINKFDKEDKKDLKNLGFNGSAKDFNHYYIEHSFKNIDYYVFSTSTIGKIDEFLKQIIEREEEIKQGKKYNKLVFEEETNGKWYLKYKGEEMWVRENEMTKSIRLNICLLMFGQKTIFVDENTGDKIDIFLEPGCEDYKIGSKVHAGALSDIIIIRGDLVERDFITTDVDGNSLSSRENEFRKIRDAAKGINIRSRKKLGIDIFIYKDQQLNVIKK